MSQYQIVNLLPFFLLLSASGLIASEPGVLTPKNELAPQEPPASLLERDYLTGDWGGLRPHAVDRGFRFSFEITHEYLANVSGGLRRGGEYNGLIFSGIELDLEALAGWGGGLIHADVLYTFGASLSERYVGDDANVSNINFHNSVRLFDAWFQQSLFGERLVLRAGQLMFDADFGSSCINDDLSAGDLFLNSDFGALPIVSFNVPVPIFAISAPGAIVRVQPTSWLYFQTAIYDGNPSPGDFGDPSPDSRIGAPRNDHNVRYRLADDEGFLWAGELGFVVNPPSEAVENLEQLPTAGESLDSRKSGVRLPGVYKVGFFYHSDEFTDFATGAPATGNYGGYLVASQMVCCECGDQGLTLFGRVGVAPKGRNVLQCAFDAGAVYKGLIPGRDADDFGLAFSYKRYSGDFNAAEAGADHDPCEHEAVLEMTYRFKITGSMSLQPDVQYVINPAGASSGSDAWVVGLRSAIIF